MKILLLGGTGAMGSHLSAILSSQKDKSIAITSRKSHPSSNNIRYIAGNAHDNAFLDELLTEKYDVIVDFMVYNTDEFRKRATKLLKSCTQYVFISSSRVYADTEMVITEDSPRLLDTCTDEEYLTTDEYALTKARQENILKTAGGEIGRLSARISPLPRIGFNWAHWN